MPENKLIALTQKLTQWIIIAFTFVFPLYFLPITSEFNEYNKIILLIITTAVIILLWVIRVVIERQLTISRTPLDSAFLVIIVVFLLSTITSLSRYTSLFGEFNSWHWMTVEIVAWVVLLYVVLTQVTKDLSQKMILAFLASAFISAILAILIYFRVFNAITFGGIFKHLEVIKVDGFLPSGSGVSALALFIVAIFFSGYYTTQFIAKRKEASTKSNLVSLLIPVLVGMTILAGLVVSVLNYLPVREGHLTFNQLDFSTSWKIASLSIRDYPLLGTGPGTYSIAYNAYRPVSINMTNNWATIFDRSGSEYLTWLTTLGLAGLFALVFFVIRIFSVGRTLMASDFKGIRFPVFVSLGSLFIAYIFISSTAFTTGLVFLLLIIWLISEKFGNSNFIEDVQLNLATKQKKIDETIDVATLAKSTSNSSILALVIASFIIILDGLVVNYTVKDFVSNLYYSRSMRLINNNGSAQDIYTSQQNAINYNPYREEYHRTYADTNLRLANLIATQKGENLSDADQSDITNLVQQSIREVRVVTELINPNSAYNWQVRGNIYQNLLGVATGADQWAYSAYQNAIQLAPFDPRLRVNMGSLFYTLAITPPAEGTEGNAPSSDVPNVPQSKEANLAQAEAAFLDAINLKSDYANAHYNLASVYKVALRYDLAEQQLQATIDLIGPNSPDYQQVNTELDEVHKLAEESK